MNVPRVLLARKVQVAVVVLLVLAAVAGATMYGDLFGEAGEETIADQVPEDVDAVAYVNASLLADETTREAINRSLPVVGRSPEAVYTAVGAGLERIAAGPGVDPRGVDSVMAYAKLPGNDPANLTRTGIRENGSYAGAIVHSSWNESALADSLARTGEVRRGSHLGQPVYRITIDTAFESDVPVWVGVLDAAAGEYVVGTRPAVDDAIAVETGEADAFDGGLRRTFEKTREGPARVATVVPGDFLAKRFGDQVPVDPDNLRIIAYAGGTYYTEGETLGGQAVLLAETGNEASKLKQLTEGGIALTKQTTDDPLLEFVLEGVTVSRSGEYVVLDFETTLAAVEAADEGDDAENATNIPRAPEVRGSR